MEQDKHEPVACREEVAGGETEPRGNGSLHRKSSYRLVKVDLEVLVQDVFIRTQLRPDAIETHVLQWRTDLQRPVKMKAVERARFWYRFLVNPTKFENGDNLKTAAATAAAKAVRFQYSVLGCIDMKMTLSHSV